MKTIMNHMKYLILLIPFLIISNIFSGPIYEEYKKREQVIKEIDIDPAIRKTQLNNTLLGSLKIALVKFYDYLNYKDVTTRDFTYEKVNESEHTFYVKYKEFLGYFVYAQDPGLYFTAPIQQNLLLKPNTEIPKLENVVDDWGEGDDEDEDDRIQKAPKKQ